MMRKMFCLATVLCSMFAVADTLIENGNFANGLAGWDGNKQVFSVQDNVLTAKGMTDVKSRNFVTFVHAIPPLKPGSMYKLSIKYRTQIPKVEKKYARACVRLIDSNKKTISYEGDLLSITNSADWTVQSSLVRVAPSAVAAQVYLVVSNLEDGDLVQMTDVMLDELPVFLPEDGNLVKNGDFSYSLPLAFWSVPIAANGKAAQIVRKDEKLGKNVLVVRGLPESKYNGFLTLVQELPALDQGVTYKLSGRLFANLKTDLKKKFFRVQVRQVDANGKSVDYTGFSAKLTGGEEWQELNKEFKADARSVRFQLYISVGYFAAEDEVLLDKVSLTVQK